MLANAATHPVFEECLATLNLVSEIDGSALPVRERTIFFLNVATALSVVLCIIKGRPPSYVGRLAGEPESTPIGVAAIVVAAVVLLVPLAGALLHRVADVRNAEV